MGTARWKRRDGKPRKRPKVLPNPSDQKSSRWRGCDDGWRCLAQEDGGQGALTRPERDRGSIHTWGCRRLHTAQRMQSKWRAWITQRVPRGESDRWKAARAVENRTEPDGGTGAWCSGQGALTRPERDRGRIHTWGCRRLHTAQRIESKWVAYTWGRDPRGESDPIESRESGGKSCCTRSRKSRRKLRSV